MTHYLDSSVILRVVLGQPNALHEWSAVQAGVASAIVEVECLRTLDRLRVRAGLSEDELVGRREAVHRVLDSLDLIELTHAVLRRASQPLPTELGTLDAVHLASAMLWAESRDDDLVVATHDAALSRAARSVGFAVLGA